MSTLLPLELAIEHHILQVMAYPVQELQHAELLGFVVFEVGLLSQGLQNCGVRQMRVRNLQVDIQQGQQLSSVVQVIGGKPGEPEAIEVAEGHCWEDQALGHHLIHLGDVLIGEVVGHPLRAFNQQQAQGTHEGHCPKHTPDGQRPIHEDVADAMESGGVGKDLDAGRLQAALAGALLQVHRDPVQFRNWLQVDQISGKSSQSSEFCLNLGVQGRDCPASIRLDTGSLS
ncbi:hypothetical protein LEMLEM_LOCUS27066 [Lemmus lemmus]